MAVWTITIQEMARLSIERRCTCCDKPLKNTAVMLELDQRVNKYHDFQNVPGDDSQGWFPFGTTCANKARHEARVALEEKGLM